MHLPRAEQAGVLLLLKLILGKYPAARSALQEVDEDAADGGFGFNANYRPNIGDPALANASQSHCVFELLFTYNLFVDGGQQHENFKLARSILNSENLPNEFLGVTPLQLVKKLTQDF